MPNSYSRVGWREVKPHDPRPIIYDPAELSLRDNDRLVEQSRRSRATAVFAVAVASSTTAYFAWQFIRWALS
jgi:hypothetical protein